MLLFQTGMSCSRLNWNWMRWIWKEVFLHQINSTGNSSILFCRQALGTPHPKALRDALKPIITFKGKKRRLCFGKTSILESEKPRDVIDSFIYSGSYWCRQISETEVCCFTRRGSSCCSTRSKQGDHSLAGWELFVSKATSGRLFPPSAPWGTFNLWLGSSNLAGGQKRSPAPRNVSKGWQRGVCQVPEIPCNGILLRQIYLQIKTQERQLSLPRHFLTSLGVILIIEPFKRVQQKWIKLNSLLKLPEASQPGNEFLYLWFYYQNVIFFPWAYWKCHFIITCYFLLLHTTWTEVLPDVLVCRLLLLSKMVMVFSYLFRN